uniref:Uncharacterized protein n=1 Tax=Cacopsylla melanoneura TaxID=428564 RepID=A0A8D9BHS0_9HEMI
MIQSVLMVSTVISSLVQSHPFNQSGPDKYRNENNTRSNTNETKSTYDKEQNSQDIFTNETFKYGPSQAQINNTPVGPLQNDYSDYIVQLSKDIDWKRDKAKVKALMKKFRSKFENVSQEDFNLEEKLKPYFRGKRNVHNFNHETNISKENPEFKIFDPFQGLEIPTNFPSTLNHPEEIKRWMQEVLPSDSKEKIPVNDTVCHQRALEALNTDLKRNISRPYAHYYKKAREEEMFQFAANKFYERQAISTTQNIKYTTKCIKQIRDEIKENMGTMLDDTSLSGPSESMPSYLVREFREKYPQHCNDDAESVDLSNFILGNVNEKRKRRDVNDVLKEKLEEGNSQFESRLKTILSRSENKIKRTKATQVNETSEFNLDSAARERLAKNALHKKFQSFTINYDETPNESWETENTKLFSFGNSLEEFINSKQIGDFKHLVGLKRSKVDEYLKSVNSKVPTNNATVTRRNRHNNCFISEDNKILGEKLKPSKEISKKIIKNITAEEQTKSKRPDFHREHQIGVCWTRPTFRKILRTQVFRAAEMSPLDESQNLNHIAFNLHEAFPNKNNTKSHSKEQGNGNSEENIIYDLKTDLESGLDFKNGLFGLKSCNPDAFAREKVPKTGIRTTDIIIKKFAKINSTWPSPLRTQVFKNSDMEGYALESSGASGSRRNSKLVKTKRKKRNVSDGKQSKHNLGENNNIEHDLPPEKMSSRELLDKFDDKPQFKKPDFVKAWDAMDKQNYNNPNFKVIEDDGTGDMPRMIREQCKEPSEEDDVIEGNKSLLKEFKEIEDYGAKSMPSQLKPDGGKSDENNTNFNNYFDMKRKELISSEEIRLDSNTYDYTNWDENDPQKRYKIRLERLEKLMGKKFSTAGPEYFTMPTVKEEKLATRSIMSTEAELITSKLGTHKTRKHEPIIRTKSEEKLLSSRNSPHEISTSKTVDRVDGQTTVKTKPTWITADSGDIIGAGEGDKEQLELFLNNEQNVENDEPWTQFDHKGMEKFLGKTLPGNSSVVYKLYRL